MPYIYRKLKFNTLSECYRQGAYSDDLGGENDEPLIAQISALHNPDVSYWQERLRKLSEPAKPDEK